MGIYPFGAISNCFGQPPGEWTWMKGDATPNSAGVFGIQTVANLTNKPPALYEPCEWKDNNGNFWLFGGTGVGGVGSNRSAALWKYDPTNNQWSWMKGPSVVNQAGVYGTQGTPSAANYPGARGLCVTSWVGASGDLWLFGGEGYDVFGVVGMLNDLWKYNVTTNEWTWMKGPNTAVDPGSYGAQGISNPANLPPSRAETSCSWTDNAGNLWLYGGQRFIGSFGDLWKYDISVNEWTWMHGVLPPPPTPPSVYGIQGTAAPANTPGGRTVYCSWTDLSGNFWLFGGGSKNDLWKYDPNLTSLTYNQWTWVKGPGTTNDTGNYGTQCVPANSNMPPARFENRARVRDVCGNFWNFGGSGPAGLLNDLWHYNLSTNQWTWVSGDNIPNQAAVYGVQGLSNPANKPGAKTGSVAWIDNNGYIWVFGGRNVPPATGTFYNDLFRFVPDSACVPLSAVVSVSSNATICSGQSLTLIASGGTSYLWSPGGQSTSSIVVNPTVSTTYSATGSNGCGSASSSVTVTVASSIAISKSDSFCVGSSYILPSGMIVNGAGVYVDTLTSKNGCDSIITTTLTVRFYIWSAQSISICSGKTYTLPGGTVVNASGVYIDTLVIPNDCKHIVTTTLTVNPAFAQNQSASICAGSMYTLPGGTAVGTSGIYKDTLLAANGCDSIITTTLNVNQAPVVTICPDITITQGTAITLNASGGGNYQWSTGESTQNISVSPIQTTTYCVTVTGNNGCTARTCVTVTIENPCVNNLNFTLPNAFSPNNDGENDGFCLPAGQAGLQGAAEDCIKYLHIIIYDRWGEKVFESDNKKFCWDGVYEGKLQNTSVFVYYLDATLVSEKAIKQKGNISLVK